MSFILLSVDLLLIACLSFFFETHSHHLSTRAFFEHNVYEGKKKTQRTHKIGKEGTITTKGGKSCIFLVFIRVDVIVLSMVWHKLCRFSFSLFLCNKYLWGISKVGPLLEAEVKV